MKLPFLKSKSADSDYYLAIILTDDKASAVILKENNTVLKTINIHEEFLPQSIEDIPLESFIDIVDKTISRAEEVLPPQIETHKTVFGVKDKWVEKETKKIKKEYLDKLKKVCDALDLQPIGFMVTTEAITHLIQDEEGAPLSAVLAEIGEKQVTLNLLRGGKVVESISSTLLHSAPHTVDKLLSHFTVPVLPARIVLYLIKPDEDANQAFIAHHWSKSLPFLHIPQITLLPKGFDTRSVMSGAASQMGFTVEAAHHTLPKLTSEERKEEEAIADEVAVEEEGQTESEDQVEEKTEEDKHEPVMDNIAPVHDGQAEEFGFVVNGDPKTHHHEDNNESEQSIHDDRDEDEEEEKRPRKHHGNALLEKLPFLATIKDVIPKNIKVPNVAKLFGGLKGKKAPLKIIIPVAAVLVLLIGSSLFYINSVKATIVLSMSPKAVTKNTTVTFTTDGSSDFEKNVVQARSISASIPTQLSTTATGKKDVGDKAKGSVTIYNNSDDPVNLKAGTELKAGNGEVFVTDKDLKIDAESGDIFTGTKPGTADTSVTAKELGTEGNIASGTRFTIGSTSSLAARNDAAFSGGTKKNVTVISKADLDKLRKEAEASVDTDGKDKLLAEAKSGETVLPVVGDATLQNVKFDKKEGDEASKVTLTASVVFAGMAYQDSEFESYAQKVLESEFADAVKLADKSAKGKIEEAELDDEDTVEASVVLEGGLLPDINTDDVIKNVKDKSYGQAKETLSNLPQVAKTDITFSPPVFLIQNLFPRLPNQISVEIKTE